MFVFRGERLKEDGDAFDVKVLKDVAQESIVLLENNGTLSVFEYSKNGLVKKNSPLPMP